MPMNEIIRERRKALGLTQEQVADYLGVTAPAVNKWEKGATYPDIALLSPLSRLLGVDPNTLLCFGEGPSGQEVARLCSEIGAAMRTGGFARGFDLAMTHLRTYPACAPLLHSAAMLLDGGLMMSGLSPEEREPYAARIITLYERAADCGDGEIRVSSTFLLASKHIASGQYDSAQALLDRLPERSAMDKRLLQANLWARQGKLDQAAEVLESRLLSALNELQALLLPLAEIARKEGRDGDADRIAEMAGQAVDLFGQWSYAAAVPPFQLALAREDAAAALVRLSELLEAVLAPWDCRSSPLYRHLPLRESSGDFGAQFLPALLADLESDPGCGFLRSSPEFHALIARYRAKC